MALFGTPYLRESQERRQLVVRSLPVPMHGGLRQRAGMVAAEAVAPVQTHHSGEIAQRDIG
jgi:hypothetical protein